MQEMHEMQIQSLGQEDSPGVGNTGNTGNPSQYLCLENSMDRGAWWDTVHQVAKSQTRLSDFNLDYVPIFCSFPWFFLLDIP